MVDVWSALKSYLYGIGWLIIVVQFTVIGYRVFDYLIPIDTRKEIEKQNMAMALLLGLFLFALVFGGLYFAAHAS